MAKERTNAKDALYTIYGARINKDETRVNLSIVKGEDDAKEWGTISIKLGSTTAKTKAVIKEGFAYIKVPLLENKEEAEEIDLPF